MARKESSTIVQEELYPADHSRREYSRESSRDQNRDQIRESIDDARLIDLDVDEQSPFLRGQKRVSARRSSLPKRTANRLLWAAIALALLAVATIAAAALYQYGEHSWRFRVESSDNIEVSGMQNVTKAQIMEVMGADIGRNIFFIPLTQQKLQLEQISWVESASVMRFVPNRLRVEVHERTPVAFARVGPRIFLIDAVGTLMELPRNRKYSFPVILGMYPGEPLSTRAPRMKAYNDLVRQLDSDGAHYSQDLSEVDLSDLDDLKVRVNDPAGDVLLELGTSDYLKRFKTYTSHVQEWRQQFQKLESVNLRYDNQVIVNPDLEGKPKPAALSSAAIKAAAAAGVKPASIITPLPLHDRSLPKPVFELSQQTLHSKPNPVKPAVSRSVEKKPAEKKLAEVKTAEVKTEGAKLAAKKSAWRPKPKKAVAKHKAVAVKPAHAASKSTAQARKPAGSVPAPINTPKPSAAIAKQANPGD
ncbi:MAG: FtsQ-type POTRA domain-containing protein [Candidatus Sulfotelmatobacter sp.]